MITPVLAVILVIAGATLGAGTVALCVAARRGDDDADVAQFLSTIEFSQFNQGRDVLVNRHDFNRMAQLAARAASREKVAQVLPCTICGLRVMEHEWRKHYAEAHRVYDHIVPSFDLVGDDAYPHRNLAHEYLERVRS